MQMVPNLLPGPKTLASARDHPAMASWPKAALLAAGLALLAQAVTFFKDPPPPTNPVERAAQALLASQIRCGTTPANVIDRPAVVERFSRFLNTDTHHLKKGYLVVTGPRGGGKSLAVQEAVKNRTGTLSVTITSDSNVYEIIADAIYTAEFEAFGTKSLRGFGFNIKTDAQLAQQVAQVMKKATELRTPHDPSWVPTIIVEVDATDEVVTTVARMLKRLCVDHSAAHVILVLSDIPTPSLPNYHARQEIMWVEDFSEVEAHAYLDKFHFLLADPTNLKDVEAKRARRQELYATVGSRAAYLEKAVCQGEDRLAAYIEHMQRVCEQELHSLLDVTAIRTTDGVLHKSDFQQLVRDMLKRDEGLPTNATRGYLPANPAFVTRVFRVKGQHAVMYHEPTSTYQFHLPAHRQAAALWNHGEQAVRGTL